ncbi:Major Facilitator Superfamily protein [Arboricoccus pini]|uniref:Major Facilitator Superfamily protein n=1 Tax=Arboricoccus pini TaxID=1963835 RepID=A0A212R4C2_9PROT|nr:MFS transporter [Arboricoccus pini]SNB66866.1 Major Facilitator Superfamily protein [Arboricoccus pini]
MTSPPSSQNKGRISVLLSVCLAGIICPMSFSGGAVATPAIGRELGGDPIALNWITNAFMLTFGGFQMIAGALVDEYGRKRVFLFGLALFAASALALSFSFSVYLLDLLRAIQGVAAAATLAGGIAALAQEFDGHGRTRAFSLLGTTFGVGLAFGPLFAGYMTETFGWSSVFLSTAVVSLLALMFGAPRMRESRDPDAAGLDVGGTITFTGALTLFTFALIQAPANGWSSAFVLTLLGGAAGLLVAFVAIETRVARPMLDLSLFRYPHFVGVQVLPIATCYCYIVLLVLLPLRFIGIEGCSEIHAGFLLLALSVPMLVVPSLAATMTRWISPGIISGVGLLIAALGLFFLGRANINDGDTTLGPMLLIGLGASMPWGLMDGLSISVVPKERAGMAAGIFNTTRVAGEGVALAIVTAVLAALLQSSLVNSLANMEAVSTTLIMNVAERLATGNLEQAKNLLPEVDRSFLAQSYADAFRVLTYILIAITIISSAIVFVILGRSVGSPATKMQSEI